MDSEKLLKLIGKVVTDNELEAFLHESGIDLGAELWLEEGEYRAYIERESLGFCLTFTDEAMFKGVNDQQIGSGPLFFSGVFFYAEGKDDYSQYTGVLPHSIDFRKNSVQLNQILGASEWYRERNDGSLISERWKDGALKIHITYSKTDLAPTVISISQPDNEL